MLRKSDRTPHLLPQTRQTRQSSLQGSRERSDQGPDKTATKDVPERRPQRQLSQQAENNTPPSLPSQALVLYNVCATVVDDNADQPPSFESTALLSKESVDVMSIEHVKTELGRTFYTEKPTCSILDYLEAETDPARRVAAAADVLNKLARTSETSAIYSAVIWRYIELQQSWTPSHEREYLHLADAFLDSLDHREYVEKMIKQGESTIKANAQSFKVINEAWGAGWYNEFKKRDLVQSTDQLSGRVLAKMAAACKGGLSILTVAEHCQERVNGRVNRPLAQGSNRTQPRQCSYIIPADFEGLTKKPNGSRRGIHETTTAKSTATSTPAMAMPAKMTPATTIPASRLDLPGNRRELQPDRAAAVTTTSVSSAADQAQKRADPVAKPARKRKLSDAVEEDGKRVVSETDKWRLVKTRNGHLIREPIRVAEESDASQNGTPWSSGPQSISTQDQPVVSSQFTQRQATVPIGSERDSASEDRHLDDSGSEDKDDGIDCEGSMILNRLKTQFSWSQDGRQCCKKCRDAITSAQYSINRALMGINSAHRLPKNSGS